MTPDQRWWGPDARPRAGVQRRWGAGGAPSLWDTPGWADEPAGGRRIIRNVVAPAVAEEPDVGPTRSRASSCDTPDIGSSSYPSSSVRPSITTLNGLPLSPSSFQTSRPAISSSTIVHPRGLL